LWRPRTGGKSVFLASTDTTYSAEWQELLISRLSSFGVSAEPAIDRLVSFFEVSNTYLRVFAALGFIGVVLGALGMGFMVLKTLHARRNEFSLLLATGFPISGIRKLLFSDHLYILAWGILTGTLSALAATWPSLGALSDLPLNSFIYMALALFATGYLAIAIAISSINERQLMSGLKNK
jgi:putative ABC transport system permease protein